MRVAFSILLALTMTGCGSCTRIIAGWKGYDRVCVDGVSYLQFTSGAALEVTKDGKPKTCG